MACLLFGMFAIGRFHGISFHSFHRISLIRNTKFQPNILQIPCIDIFWRYIVDTLLRIINNSKMIIASDTVAIVYPWILIHLPFCVNLNYRPPALQQAWQWVLLNEIHWPKLWKILPKWTSLNCFQFSFNLFKPRMLSSNCWRGSSKVAVQYCR